MKPEIDPARMLNHFYSDRSTGCLEVVCDNTSWNIVFQSGQLLSADCSVQSLGQLSHTLRQLGWDLAAKAVNTAGDRTTHILHQYIKTSIDRDQNVSKRAHNNICENSEHHSPVSCCAFHVGKQRRARTAVPKLYSTH